MAKKNKFIIGAIVIVALLVIFQQGGFFLGAVIDQQTYNGDMEDWCIRDPGDSGTGYGFLNGGTTRCDSSNSVPYLHPDYDGLQHTNEIPTLWGQKYGCCTQRSTDARSGTYSALIHKESTDDWYFFGMTGRDNFWIPASPGTTYTVGTYYKFTLDSPSETRVSLSINFYDSGKDAIDGARQSVTFTPQADWTLIEVIGVAPPGTAYIGWYNTWAQNALGDLLLDDLFIDEAQACTSGDTEPCSSDVGICTIGIRTCDGTGNWGACSGVTPGSEICDNNLDDDCDGTVDEGCSSTVLTRSEMVTWYDLINLDTNNNLGYSEKTSPTWWAWDNAPIAESQINMYLATSDTKYLDMVVVNTDNLISKATDFTGDGLLEWEALESPIDPILTYSRNILPMVKFAYVVKKNSLTSYDVKADEYISFVEDNFIPVYDDMWFECGNMGFWGEGTTSAPNNRVSFVARTHLYLYLITGNDAYLNQVTRFANKVKSTLLEKNDGPTSAPYYFWNYNNKAGCTTVGQSWVCDTACAADQDTICETNPSGWSCSGPLELSYGNYDMMAMVDLFEAGIVFTNSDLTKIINTFKEVLLLEEARVSGVSTPALSWSASVTGTSNSPGYFSFTPSSPHWGRLGHYDFTIDNAMDEIVSWSVNYRQVAATSTWYNEPYLCVENTLGSAGEICSLGGDDGMRTTPAYLMSSLAHQILASETLSVIGGGTTPSCGDGTCDSNENCGTCAADCTVPTGDVCCNNAATTGDCCSDSDCTGEQVCGTGNLCAEPPVTCGDEIIDSGEDCDGTNINITCLGLGFDSGTLGCLSDCTYDNSSCTTSTTSCGDGVCNGNETSSTCSQDCEPEKDNNGILFILAIAAIIFFNNRKKKRKRR